MNDKPTVNEAIASYEIVKRLVKLGYPHNFQHEAPWVVDYCNKISKIISEAFEIKERQECRAKGESND